MSKMPATGICFQAAYGHSSKMHLFLFRHGTVNHFGTRESWKLYQGTRTTHTPKEEKWYDFSADCTDMVFLGPASKRTVSQLWHQFLTLQPSDNRKAAKGSNQIRNRCVATSITRTGGKRVSIWWTHIFNSIDNRLYQMHGISHYGKGLLPAPRVLW